MFTKEAVVFTELNYFHPNRTQPFLITLFQVILAFKRICKMMKIRMNFRKSRLSARRRASTLRNIIRKSSENAEEAKVGKSVLVSELELHPPVLVTTAKPAHESVAGDSSPPRTNADIQLKTFELKVSTFRHKHVMQTGRVEALAEKLNKMAAWKERACSRNGGRRSTSEKGDKNPLQSYFKNFAATMLAEEYEEDASPIVVEYLSGSAIYFGATIALQARHGGFLGFYQQEVKASAHKVLSNCRLTVKKSEDLTDVGLVRYGDALWLQVGANYVFGATYGSLVEKKRQIQPALVSCKRQSMFKAQQYGRWIVLNRDDPIGSLGKSVCHMDKVMLEQEWSFLASSSPYETSMFKTVNNSDEAMRTKMDLFQPSEECCFRIHLVALPSDNGESERQRQKLLHRAKEQIDGSEQNRFNKSGHLLTSLSSQLSPKHKEEAVVSSELAHKRSELREQEHLHHLYRKMSSAGFQTKLGTENFLSNTYGPDSPIVALHNGGPRASRSVVSASQSSSIAGAEQAVCAQKDELQRQYWTAAQTLLVPAQSWAQLPKKMASYYEQDRERKNKSARIIQKFMREALNRHFDYERAMKRVDKQARSRLEDKMNERRRLIMEHTANLELLMVQAAPQSAPNDQSHNPKTPQCSFHNQSATAAMGQVSRRQSLLQKSSEPQATLSVANSRSLPSTPLRRQSTSKNLHSPASQVDSTRLDRLALRQSIVHALASYFPVEGIILNKETKAKILPVHSLEDWPEEQDSRASSFSMQSGALDHRRPHTASAAMKAHSRGKTGFDYRPSSAGQADQMVTPSLAQECLRKDKERLARTSRRQFGLPADVFRIPVSDAYEHNANVGLKFLKSVAKSGLFSDVNYRRRRHPMV